MILLISGGFNSDPRRHYFEAVSRITGIEGSSTNFQEAIREVDFEIVNEVKKSIGRLNRADTTV